MSSFFQTISAEFSSPASHHLGSLVILVLVLGGVVIVLMARFRSEKIRGHGIPEALEAIQRSIGLKSFKTFLHATDKSASFNLQTLRARRYT